LFKRFNMEESWKSKFLEIVQIKWKIQITEKLRLLFFGEDEIGEFSATKMENTE